MKRIILTACVVISGCGSNSPQVEDIKKELEKDLAGCSYIEISNIQKENGMEGDSKNTYVVEQKYTASFKPSATQIEIMKEGVKIREVAEKYAPQSRAIGEEISRLQSEYRKKSVEVSADNDLYNSLRQEHFLKIKELEEKRMDFARQNGFSSYASLESPTAYINANYTAKAQHEFLQTCAPNQKMRRNGIDILSKLFAKGYAHVFLNGESLELRQKMIYTKTENGWIVLQ